MPAASPSKRALHVSTGALPTSQISNQSNGQRVDGTDSFITANNYDLPRSPGKVPGQQTPPNQTQRELEIENLKTIIIALNQKVKARDDIEQELNQLKEAHKVSNTAREDLRAQLENASHAFADEQGKSAKFQELIIEENQNR
jgi:vacuolar-type H+-ATPase subunit I/STV1